MKPRVAGRWIFWADCAASCAASFFCQQCSQRMGAWDGSRQTGTGRQTRRELGSQLRSLRCSWRCSQRLRSRCWLSRSEAVTVLSPGPATYKNAGDRAHLISSCPAPQGKACDRACACVCASLCFEIYVSVCWIQSLCAFFLCIPMKSVENQYPVTARPCVCVFSASEGDQASTQK